MIRLLSPFTPLILLALYLSACQSDNTGPGTEKGNAHLEQLRYNPRWYRTFDSTQSITPSEGTLLFNWLYRDETRHPDSFFVGIDTLWSLPYMPEAGLSQWDMDVCPGGSCIGGLAEKIFGGNSAPFAASSVDGDTFTTEHHFQFFPAIINDHYTAPEGTIMGGFLYVRSLSGSSKTDTVFGFGAWKMEWDTAYPPPVRPVHGYLPRRSDFVVVNGRVRYQP